jgi:hypothetical protein
MVFPLCLKEYTSDHRCDYRQSHESAYLLARPLLTAPVEDTLRFACSGDTSSVGDIYFVLASPCRTMFWIEQKHRLILMDALIIIALYKAEMTENLAAIWG